MGRLRLVREAGDPAPAVVPWRSSPAGLASLARIGRKLPHARVLVIVQVTKVDGGETLWLRPSEGQTRADVLWTLEAAKRAIMK